MDRHEEDAHENMEEQLNDRLEMLLKLHLDFLPLCRGPVSGSCYLEALLNVPFLSYTSYIQDAFI